MDVQVERNGNLTIVAPQGPRLDAAAAPGFKSAVLDLIHEGARTILVDLSAIDFMDSTGLAGLMSSMKSLSGEGEMALCSPSDKVRKLFAITKLDRGVFRVFEDRAQALAAL